MKRFIFTLIIALSVSTAVYAAPEFGELSFDLSQRTAFYSEGGAGDNIQNFGFFLKGEGRELYLRQYLSSFSSPYSLRLKSIPDGEYTLSQYAKENDTFFFGEKLFVYVTAGNVSVKTLQNFKYEAKSNVKGEVDLSLYRDKEIQMINSIFEEFENKIDACNEREQLDAVCDKAREEISAVKKSEYFAEIARQNSTELEYLAPIYNELSQKASEMGSIIEGICSIAKDTIALGTSGDLLITDENVKSEFIHRITPIVTEYSNLSDSEAFHEMLMVFSENTQDYIHKFLEEDLNYFKAIAKGKLKSYIDFSLYRESEKLQINTILDSAYEKIVLCENKDEISSIVSETKALLDKVNKKAYYDEVAILNKPYIENLNVIKTDISSMGFEAQTEVVISILDEVIALGTSGDIVITDTYITDNYYEKVPDAKILYNKLTIENKIDFQNKLETLTENSKTIMRIFFPEDLDCYKHIIKLSLDDGIDFTPYREKEQNLILEMIVSYSTLIDEASDKAEIDSLKAQFRKEVGEIKYATHYAAVAKQNEESGVIANLEVAIDAIENSYWKGDRKKIIVDIALPVAQEIKSLGETGDILITEGYVKNTYQEKINKAKGIFNGMSKGAQSLFIEDVFNLGPETFNFLSDFFGVDVSDYA